MDKIDVSAIDIRDYALSNNWELVKDALKDGLFVLNSPFGDFSQLIIPKDDSDSLFPEMAQISIERLANLYKFSIHKIIEDIREVNDDVICLRYFSENKNVNSISFEEAFGAIEATRQMLLSATSSIVSPALFHPKLNRSEAQDLIKKTRFRHTEEGSFILKISHPCEIITSQENNLFNETELEKPISRSAFELINSSSIKIIDAIESNSINALFEEEQESQKPTLSYNFCESLSHLYDNEREIPFQLIFNWSKASINKIPKPKYENKVLFPYSSKNKITELTNYFTPKRESLKNEKFYGTVDSLDGAVGEDGKRSGSVTLTILHENDTFKTKVNLPSNWYDIAVDAHKKGGAYVQIVGDLKRGKRSHSIENVTSFNVM